MTVLKMIKCIEGSLNTDTTNVELFIYTSTLPFKSIFTLRSEEIYMIFEL